jgi:superfamily II DNA or RNA helicase
VAPTLRPYQHQLLADIRAAVRQGHRRIVAVMPTGAGKGTTIGAMVASAAAKGNRTLVLAHRAELIQQLSDTATTWGVPHGVIAAGRSMDNSKLLQVGSVQTVIRRLDRMFPPDIIIVDEAHHLCCGNTWGRVIDRWPGALLIGKTATPCRTNGAGLGDGHGGYFTAMVMGPTAAWLTEQGFLSPARILAPPGIALQGLRKRMGDYDMKQAAEMLSSGQAMGSPLSHYRQHLEGQTAIAFCCSVAHAEAVAQLFNDHGIPAASIDGSMDAASRRLLLEQLGTGTIKVLTSCSLIGEGVDVPSVAGCILLRPTQSLSLHLQMIGRCLRPAPGKTHAVVLDHVGNTLRHGLPTDDREWTLDGVQKRQREAAPSVRVCPACFAAMPSGAPQCPECGHQFQPERRELEHVEGELQEVIARQARRAEQSSAQSFDDLVRIGRRRGMANPRGWARHVLAAREAKRERSGQVRVVA